MAATGRDRGARIVTSSAESRTIAAERPQDGCDVSVSMSDASVRGAAPQQAGRPPDGVKRCGSRETRPLYWQQSSRHQSRS